MKKTKALRFINVLLAIDLIIIITTAAFHGQIYPTGYYRMAHALPGTIFVMLISLHLFLNWSWIKSNYLKRKS